MTEFKEQEIIKVGKITQLAVPPACSKSFESMCSCEDFSQQALAWIIQTAGDYYDGRKLHRRYATLGNCKELRGTNTLDFEGRRFHINDDVYELIFGPIKWINLFQRVFSDYDPYVYRRINGWRPTCEECEVCKYFHPWKPEKTEEVEDEPVMLRCHRADENYSQSDDSFSDESSDED